MQIEFVAGPVAATASPVARVVDQDGVPATLEAVLIEGARASRFTGKAGQVFEGFVSRDGAVVRAALAGAGAAGAGDRTASLERAGAALTAKYLASGEQVLTIDFTGTALSAGEVAAVLLGARLRGWRHDAYRTKLADDHKVSLGTLRVVGAPAGTEAAWQVEAALAEGIGLERLHRIVGSHDLVFVDRAFADTRREDLPQAAVDALAHRVPASVPGVEVSHHRDAAGMGRPHGEVHAAGIDLIHQAGAARWRRRSRAASARRPSSSSSGTCSPT